MFHVSDFSCKVTSFSGNERKKALFSLPIPKQFVFLHADSPKKSPNRKMIRGFSLALSSIVRKDENC